MPTAAIRHRSAREAGPGTVETACLGADARAVDVCASAVGVSALNLSANNNVEKRIQAAITSASIKENSAKYKLGTARQSDQQ